jgi:hypothetical protein
VWQLQYEALRSTSFEIVSIAMEHGGAALARPFVQAAGATFPTVVDEQGLTAVAFGFKAVPNGLLVDEAGIVRYAKYGGFSVDKGDDLAAVERFARGEDPGASPDDSTPYRLGALENDLVATKLRLGRLLAAQGRLEDAADEWRSALHVDPANLVIRKQIWAVLHPERFHPTIDWEWQGVQFARERAEELASGVCGPDGCPLPH